MFSLILSGQEGRVIKMNNQIYLRSNLNDQVKLVVQNNSSFRFQLFSLQKKRKK